jgi:hypothetical protein
VRGPQEGLALVRSLWRAELRLERWAPGFETVRRRLVPAADALRVLIAAEAKIGPLYRRMFVEAAISSSGGGPRHER